jgi:hypothetical protein
LTEIAISTLEIYAFCDPASGKDAKIRRRRARQAIIVAGRDWLDRWFVLHAWAGTETPTQLLHRILDVYDKWRPRRFGIEANGMQVLFGSLVRDAGRERFGDIRIIPVYQSTHVEKTFRIRNELYPVISQGRLFLSDKTSALAIEIRGFPTAATKDLVDCLGTVVNLAPKRPEKLVKSAQMEQYASYLRNTGCPPHLIAEKLATYERENEPELAQT